MKARSARRRRPAARLVAAAAVLSIVLLWFTPAPAGAATPVTGGGSGFAALEIDQWRADTARQPFNLTVNYVSQGSSFGRQQFIDGNLDFGASDITFQTSDDIIGLTNKRCGGRAPAACFVYVPVSAGGLAFMYNLVDSSGHRVTNLQLTRDAACGIFTGAITKWNDPAIVSTNPSLANFSQPIIPVLRSDGAGESYVLSQFCIAVDPQRWAAFIPFAKAHDPNTTDDFKAGRPTSVWPNWSVPSQLGADGTANVVADPVAGQNAITYVAAGYAKVRNFPVASLQNAAGVFTQPNEDNVTVALGYAVPNPDPNAAGTFILNFQGADARSYFPSTYSYIIAQTTGFDPGKGATLGQFLCYAISKGQVIAPQLRYARLSAPLVQIAIAAISKIPGAPPPTGCFLAGAPPPPPPPSITPGNATGGAVGPGGTAGPAGSGPGGTAANGATANQGANGTGPCPSGSSTTTSTTSASSSASSTTAPATTTTTAASTTSTTTAATTTTTVACDTALEGSGGGGSIDSQLAAAAGEKAKASGTSDLASFGLLLAGAFVALLVSELLRARRKVSG